MTMTVTDLCNLIDSRLNSYIGYFSRTLAGSSIQCLALLHPTENWSSACRSFSMEVKAWPTANQKFEDRSVNNGLLIGVSTGSIPKLLQNSLVCAASVKDKFS